mmetsp:Transcript_8596/g.7932  ORF Transcript_8596/g.7932 Transcript_8596/m.7932 type:complete len:226 (+) Transcript_8596:402-1079(+)
MGHSSCLWKGSHIVIFGGWNGYNVLSDVIFIDLRNGLDRITFNIPQVIKGEAPMRQFHTANIIENKMYVFGGGDGKSWLNELMILDLLNLEWNGPINFQNQMNISPFESNQSALSQQMDVTPSGRLQHSSVASDSKIYIFGGEPDQFRQLNDIWSLDTKTLIWEKPKTTGQEPSARVSSTGCLVDNKIYYFGGYDGLQWLNDVHSFDIQTNRWEKINIPGHQHES